MKKAFIFFLLLFVSFPAFAQTDIKFEDLLEEIDWDNCTESDVIYLFKDNVVKNEDEFIDGNISSSYDIVGVQIGKYHSSFGHIDVNKYSKKLVKIVLLIDKEEDWQTPGLVQSTLESYLKTIFGNRYYKIIEYGLANDIECIWQDNYDDDCGVRTWVVQGSKTAGITLKKGVNFKYSY